MSNITFVRIKSKNRYVSMVKEVYFKDDVDRPKFHISYAVEQEDIIVNLKRWCIAQHNKFEDIVKVRY